MKTSCRFLASPSRCGYLHDQVWQLEYGQIVRMSADEYAGLLLQGWRRFGRTLFRPRCPTCSECRSLRIVVESFRADRSQGRARRANEGRVELKIGRPALRADALSLYRRFHRYQAESKGWPDIPRSPDDYSETFVDNPFPTEEWRHELDGRLIGVGHVDAMSVGLSAIYFVHDPAERRRSLGTWNVLCLIDEARRRGLSHVYLGYHVAGCSSLAYKSRFRPHEVLGPDGRWSPPVEPNQTPNAAWGQRGG